MKRSSRRRPIRKHPSFKHVRRELEKPTLPAPRSFVLVADYRKNSDVLGTNVSACPLLPRSTRAARLYKVRTADADANFATACSGSKASRSRNLL